MKIFVTGATGFIGSAVVKDLLASGYDVLGLARSDAGATSLAATGARVHRGSLEDLESLKTGAAQSGAAQSDGVIHTAFIHDFSRFKEICEVDRHAIAALGEALTSSNRPLIITSGTGLLSPGKLATEDQLTAAGSSAIPRIASEEAADAVASKGVLVSIVRLPPTVHGQGDHAFIPLLINLARQKGAAAYVGEGLNRWPAVHRLDAARLYRLALKNTTTGARFHGVAEEGVPMRTIAETIARRLNVPAVSKSPAEASEHFGWFAHFAQLDNPTSSQKTRDLLGWQPTQPGLIADLEEGHYFKP